MTNSASIDEVADQAPPPKKRAWGDDVLSQHEQRELREKVLFETAARLFNKYGFRGTSMTMLTEELGLTKGALYHYVKGKGDLLYQLNLRAARASKIAHDSAVAEGSNGYERVHGIIRNYLEAAARSPIDTFILLDEAGLAADQRDEIVELRKWLSMDMRHQIEIGIEDGSIAPCDPKLASLTIIGAMAGMLQWYERDKAWSEEHVASAMADLLGRMIAANPKPLN